MKRVIFALVLSVALSSPAWADYYLGTLNPTATQTAALPVPGTTFDDVFHFTIGGASDSDLTVEFQGNPNADTTFDTMYFSLNDSSDAFITDWSGFDAAIYNTITFSGLDALSPGDYLVHVIGSFSSGTEFPGSYTMTFTTAVPEPEVYVMLSVGLGLMGWVGRRKKLQAT